jgi:hypothetical protein
MNNQRLNEILKSAPVPERPGEYWEEFPAQVTRELRRSDRGERPPLPDPLLQRRRGRLRAPVLAFGLGLAAVCLLIGFWLGRHGGPAERPVMTVAEAQKYYHEIAQLFPNQVRAIVFDQNGTHLVLADRADVPASLPVFMKICGPNGCQGVVTFSGQQIRVNGKSMDVLVGPMDDVILAGPDSVWSSKQAENQMGGYRIEAKALQAQL